MASGLDVQSDPVFWWWEEDGGSRVVLLTDTLLILSGALTDSALGELEAARRAGTVEAADFGADACRISVGAIERLRYVPDSHRLEVDLAGGGRFDVEPPRSNAGVALGVFDTLAKRLAPNQEPVDSHAGGAPTTEDPALTIVGAMVVFGLVCLGLAVAAGQGEPAGPLAGVRTSMNDLFERVGYLPALVLFAIATAVQVSRMRRSDSDDGDTAPVPSARVLELDLSGLGPVDAPPTEVDPLADIATPSADAAEDSWQQTTEVAPEDAWSPPETNSAWGAPAGDRPDPEPADDAWSSPDPEPADDAWSSPDPEPADDAWSSSDPEPSDDAWSSSDREPADDAWSSSDPELADDGWTPPEVSTVETAWQDEDAEADRTDLDDDLAGEEVMTSDLHDELSEAVTRDSWSEPVEDVTSASWSEPVADVAVQSWAGEGSGGDAEIPPVADEMAAGQPDAAPSDVSSDEADVAEPAPTPDVDPEFWSQSASDEADGPWWERDDAADAGDPGMLPPPPPIAEVASPDHEAAAAETAEVDDGHAAEEAHDPVQTAEPKLVSEEPDAPVWGSEGDVVQSDQVVESSLDAPVWGSEGGPVESEQVVESSLDAPVWGSEGDVVEAAQVVESSLDAPVWDSEGDVVEAAQVVESSDDPSWASGSAPAEPEELPSSSTPAPDSPFAEILDREAPMPAWASAPEPTNQLVDRAAMERSVPASLVPENAERD